MLSMTHVKHCLSPTAAWYHFVTNIRSVGKSRGSGSTRTVRAGHVTLIGLLHLPDEILLQIMEDHLGYGDVITCLKTCRRLNSMLATSLPLQYKRELAACGMLDGPHGPDALYVGERIDRLQRHSAAWNRVQIAEDTAIIRFLGGRRRPILVSGSTLLFPPASDPNAPAYMLLFRSPSNLRGIEEQKTALLPSPGDFNFIDPFQDLSIWLFTASIQPHTMYYEFLTLSSNSEHPLAYSQERIELQGYTTIRDLLRDYILESHYTAELQDPQCCVRNWKTGAVVFEKVGPCLCLRVH
ncbi:hypothetical protein BV25DRAFT_915266 [Artomyces pyxidatus]|uniref:Uncharacterized protein n=1 Tax=Artomyces pyxidatus TaxID=48021 RepID=A0ACB8SYW5_9AGAM|nr:hypothetical protein BV25DRAFT_915266 [Artomyces pyxidatus]